ncbi:MAG TPA: hypothetical protein VJR04_09475 [Terriglobales bacterium]|nr:hypothetical protein [Terriglobales bacterium]
MKLLLSLLLMAVMAPLSQGQTPLSSAPTNSVPSAQTFPDPGTLLSRIQQETLGLSADLGKLRIDKWKTDSSTKSQATDNVESLQRNITNALPGLISAVRSAPQSLGANFKLYRNINALYDVLANLAESAGAFGKHEEYEVIAPHVAAIDDDRRAYGDLLAQMTASADSRIAAYQQAAAQAAAQPPKKIIIDDTEPAPAPKKKTRKKSAASSSKTSSSKTKPASSNAATSNSASGPK